jgi:beta-glucosidase
MALEERVVASASADVPPVSVATIPAPGNAYWQPAMWQAVHENYLAQASQNRNGIVFLGDSLTQFWGNSTTTGAPGNASWDAYFAPLDALNFGIEGDFTQSILWRVENGELAGHPRVVELMAGINNLLAGELPSDAAAGDAAIVRAIHRVSPHTKILLLDLLPAHESPSDPLRSEIGETNALLQDVATGRNAVSLNLGGALTESDGTFIPGVMEPGDLHLSSAGYARIAPLIDATLLNLLRRK